jgi:hypothetical protein
MKPFKFLTTKKRVFHFEFSSGFYWFPGVLRDSEKWTSQKSDLIKGWLSEYFFDGQPNFEKIKYFPEIDRSCEIIQTGLDSDSYQQRMFTATVRICKSDNEYMEVDLQYPTDQINYI